MWMWIMYILGVTRVARRVGRGRGRGRGHPEGPVRYKPTSQPDSYCGIQSRHLVYPNGCVNSTLGNSYE